MFIMAFYQCSKFLILSFLSLTTALCYFPDGKSIPRQDTPCRSDGFATCCGQGYACLSNNLCMLTEHVANPIPGQSQYVRGSCTDPTWSSSNCPNFCIVPANGDNYSGGMGVTKCNNGTQDRYFCINDQTEPLASSAICSSSAYFFEIAATPSTFTVIGIAQTTSTSGLSTTKPPAFAVITTLQPTPSSPVDAPSTIATPPIYSASPPKKNPSILIGIGIGIPLALITISTIAFFFFRRRRAQCTTAPVFQPEPTDFYPETKDAVCSWDKIAPVQETIYYEVDCAQILPHELPAHGLGHGQEDEQSMTQGP